jgi:5,10-methylene-tetrahydrofolate dehydrogenase/methenyl tetrahydrofolate cyclohydrolase
VWYHVDQVQIRGRRDGGTTLANRCRHAYYNSLFSILPTLLLVVIRLNSDPAVHGVLIQLPLPPHISEAKVLGSIEPRKDVDGLHPGNIARLMQQQQSSRNRSFSKPNILQFPSENTYVHFPCTPQGCIELLDRYNYTIQGKEAVVIGRSNIVGIPMALMLMHRNATVTIAHSKTHNIEEVVRRADIVIAAVGRAEMVRGSWIKPGAVVIDVGINSVDDSSKQSGYRLVGDVAFDECKDVASLITPVPGGVGPMTIAMLLRNTVNSALLYLKSTLKHSATV